MDQVQRKMAAFTCSLSFPTLSPVVGDLCNVLANRTNEPW
jgi:hypothetical protein